MNVANLLSKLLDIYAKNPAIKPVVDWVVKNRFILASVSEDTLKRIVGLFVAPEIDSVAEVERQLAGLPWNERFEIMKKGIANIDSAASQRHKEIALFASLIELGLDLAPTLLMVL